MPSGNSKLSRDGLKLDLSQILNFGPWTASIVSLRVWLIGLTIFRISLLVITPWLIVELAHFVFPLRTCKNKGFLVKYLFSVEYLLRSREPWFGELPLESSLLGFLLRSFPKLLLLDLLSSFPQCPCPLSPNYS